MEGPIAEDKFYRGGTNLGPRSIEIKIDRVSGLVRSTHEISVFSRLDRLERFGGAHELTNLPEILSSSEAAIRLTSKSCPHIPWRCVEYELGLSKIVLVPV